MLLVHSSSVSRLISMDTLTLIVVSKQMAITVKALFFPMHAINVLTELTNLDGCIYDSDEAARVLYAYQRGHQVGSHTWSHADLTTLSWDQSKAGTKVTISHDVSLNVFFSLVHDEMWRVERELLRSLEFINILTLLRGTPENSRCYTGFHASS